MAFVKFKSYGRGQELFVNADRVMSFQQLDYPANCGTEISMDDGSKVRVGHWASDVEIMLNSKNNTD